jgi:hypothetical protein
LRTITLHTARGSFPFYVEIADTPGAREHGLMFRRLLLPGRGMLFLFDDDADDRGMWMKNTLIPLDMIFLTRTGIVSRIRENVPALSELPVRSWGPAPMVLELPAGSAASIGLAVGNRMTIH